MREQFERQFAPELKQLKADKRRAVLSAGDLLTQLGSRSDYLRRHRRLSTTQVGSTLATGPPLTIGLTAMGGGRCPAIRLGGKLPSCPLSPRS